MDYLFGLHFVFQCCNYQKLVLTDTLQGWELGGTESIKEPVLFTETCSLRGAYCLLELKITRSLESLEKVDF